MSDYEWMSAEELEELMPDINYRKVAKTAREHFLPIYMVTNDPVVMWSTPVDRFSNETWGQRRKQILNLLIAQYEKNPTDNKQYAMYAWAYSHPSIKERISYF